MISFLDLKAINERFRAEMDAATKRVLDSGWYLLGKECEAFEREFAAFCGFSRTAGISFTSGEENASSGLSAPFFRAS